MALKSSLYTKKGDRGDTSLVGGNRISKADGRIDLYGEVDELNSRIGYTLSLINPRDNFEEWGFLQKIQSILFDLGSHLACEREQRETFQLPLLRESIIKELEDHIDKLDSQCPKLKNFVLPGGGQVSASFHLCRTMCRKVERKMVSFHHSFPEELPAISLPFINRLSDYFFIVARYWNVVEKIDEVLWSPQRD